MTDIYGYLLYAEPSHSPDLACLPKEHSADLWAAIKVAAEEFIEKNRPAGR